jgi:hypothetical protein
MPDLRGEDCLTHPQEASKRVPPAWAEAEEEYASTSQAKSAYQEKHLP